MEIKGVMFMTNFIFVFLITAIVYSMFKYMYIFISRKLKQSKIAKNNYVVKEILLSASGKFDILDLIIVFIITFIVIYK
ncbi:hypothetical protein BUZ58_10715 [Staphylococcus hyicus]|nr:hypothetical protein BUZ58_10715 [Staphylococcus hyicus]